MYATVCRYSMVHQLITIVINQPKKSGYVRLHRCSFLPLLIDSLINLLSLNAQVESRIVSISRQNQHSKPSDRFPDYHPLRVVLPRIWLSKIWPMRVNILTTASNLQSFLMSKLTTAFLNCACCFAVTEQRRSSSL